jgi:hypothetical protein
MTDPEREHLVRRVHDLESRLRRWQLIAFVLAALLLVPVVGVGLMGVVLGPRMARERAALEELQRAREEAIEEEIHAREAAEEAVRQRDEAAQAKQQVEKRPGKEKD